MAGSDAAAAAQRASFIPFDVVEEVFGDLMYVEEFVSG